ncbi:diguanylate cyclase [Marinimicrobium sp. ARAG 43.8]|uniref:GGDEF domain-containing protein n=1 Tax=Marinimicrobium sp. ARAG 43.8 TaxID=3418719 RepID=UPI003CF6F1FA
MSSGSLKDVHWLIDLLQTIEVGIVVLDADNCVRLWNGFMENHSGIAAEQAVGQDLFALFDDLPRAWLERKLSAVRLLHTRSFSVWEQRPYLFRFRNRRPITGSEPLMFQNITFFPVTNHHVEVDSVGLLVYDVTETASDRRQLERTNAQLRRLSQIDGLTGLYNRVTWESFLSTEFERHRRYRTEAALVMLDIDHFKPINDTYGHPAGDEVIRQIASLIKFNLRQPDIAGRYGGEEFAVILPETDLDGARIFAERMREVVEQQIIQWADVPLQITVSLGVAPLSETYHRSDHWLKAADEALYRAKGSGRNQVVVAGE